MKIRVFYVLFAICLSTAFWACGKGDIYLPETEDMVAVEKFDDLKPEDFDAMMDSCLADPKCRASWDSSLGRPEWKKSEKSSSSQKDHNSHSSSSVDTSSAVIETSASPGTSADPAPVSSSSEEVKSSSSKLPGNESSSSVEPESSSSVSSSSSSEEEESSSSEEDSSSSEEEESSSSVMPESSSSQLAPPSGSCRPDKYNAAIEEPVTWTYFPDEGTFNDGRYAWSVEAAAGMAYDSNVDDGKGEGPVKPFRVKYTSSGNMDGPSISIFYGGQKIKVTCSTQNAIYINQNHYVPGPVESSSSEEDTPYVPPSNSSSSTSNGDPPPITY